MLGARGDAAAPAAAPESRTTPLNDAPTIDPAGLAAGAADRHRVLLRHRGGDALGEPLSHPHTAPRTGERSAKMLERLLQKPDDWLGANLVILAAASVFASAIATILAQRTGHPLRRADRGRRAHGRDDRVLRAGAEDLRRHASGAGGAQLRPTSIARWCMVARPLLWVTNKLAYGFLRLFGVVTSIARRPDAEHRRAAHGRRRSRADDSRSATGRCCCRSSISAASR